MNGAPPPPLAEARGIAKRFRGAHAPALADVAIRIAPGAVTGLVGPDGAGKTTLIRILCGLLRADAGELCVLGGAPAAARAAIGYMPQRFGLYEDLTVAENLDLYAALRMLPRAEREDTYRRLLAFTDLAGFRTRRAGQLSGGMKQKLGLACALVSTPRLLLLDEPGVGVDPISRRELWAMVTALTAQGIGVLWSTAYLDEAEKCDRVCLLDRGRVLHDGPPAELTRRVAGRVVGLAGLGGQAMRGAMRRARDADGVVDATIAAGSLRLLLREGAVAQSPGALGLGTRAGFEPVAARFEDAYVERLGGGARGDSALAASYRTIPESDRPAIAAAGLTKRYGDFTAARDMAFTIARGEIFGLIGPNGAGKSTTFRMLCGLTAASAGSGTVAGHDLRRAAAQARASLGYMAQKFSLYGDLSVAQNLAFFAGAYGLDRRAARRAIGEMIEIFEFAPVLGQNAGLLPLGFKQRLALACAVMHQPPVLFLDEPTSGVDPLMRREFWSHINGLVEKGVAVLVTTHFMEEAEYCDRVSLIYRAEQIASGAPAELKATAAALSGRASAGMEEAFVLLIEDSDRRRAAEPAAA
ncbi:MAG: ABC transporter ATP-binding protein [Sphingomonadales bacterium]|nr:ABC transporter ATP-binding protein [Sphingomonadales bacterium]